MTRRSSLALIVGLSLAACTFEGRTDLNGDESVPSSSEFLRPWGDSSPPVGVKSGDLVWIWGMPGIVPSLSPPRLAEGGVAAETRQALQNVIDVVAAAGGTARDVAQCSVFLAEGADVQAMLGAYAEYFPAPPTRAAVAVGGLGQGASVQVECTAVLATGS